MLTLAIRYFLQTRFADGFLKRAAAIATQQYAYKPGSDAIILCFINNDSLLFP
jgi:hypothetical protein